MPNFPNMFESATNIIQTLTDNHKNPLHVGEVMSCWTYLAFVERIIIYIEVGINTTTDRGVTELYQDALKITKAHISTT